VSEKTALQELRWGAYIEIGKKRRYKKKKYRFLGGGRGVLLPQAREQGWERGELVREERLITFVSGEGRLRWKIKRQN